ncbi:MAG: hypothetical protein KGL39_50745 [Patescibacteria group bacterium]|nr:hypothetical protein [Patescibacteria group bacterium]
MDALSAWAREQLVRATLLQRLTKAEADRWLEHEEQRRRRDAKAAYCVLKEIATWRN